MSQIKDIQINLLKIQLPKDINNKLDNIVRSEEIPYDKLHDDMYMLHEIPISFYCKNKL